MRAALLALAALALLPGAARAAEAKPASIVVRVAIVVRDMDASMRFYRDVFGYDVRYDGDITTADRQILLGLKAGQKARFVVLDGPRDIGAGHREAASIGLLAVAGKRLPRLALPRSNTLLTGQAMLAVETSDMARVLAALRKRGAPILAGPLVSHGGTETEIVTADPDGTRIHVVAHIAPTRP